MAENTLLIVESAAKAKTLSKFLGKNYKVKASIGHVKDLPKSKLGIDIENDFEPQYITIRGKGNLLKEIKEEAQKASRVLLATDPDREGEAIAWHLQNVINIPDDEKCRIEFHEITREAVKKAIAHPRPIDMNRVNAQQARRVLDRLVGYSLSPFLWNKVKKGLSAGRVQSVAVRLICEREEEIRNFIPEEYWTLDALVADDKGDRFQAKLVSYKGEKINIKNAEQKDEIIKALADASLVVQKIEKKERRKKPHPPFTTSTLQQEASRRLNFYANRTMRVAQELYEGLEIGKEGTVGLITYLRTDSTRIAEVAQKEAREFIMSEYGEEYVPEVPNEYKTKKTAQDAHEAIRPTSVKRTPESLKPYLTRDQYKLYKLIWERFVASQMAPSIYDTVSVDIEAGDYNLRATSSRLKFIGYKKVYDEEEEEEVRNPIPDIKEGEKLRLVDLYPEQHFTQPPPRFTEASLVKLLEEKNIGRPSTYAPIIETILKRNYVERQNKQFVPTELGFIVVELLKENFSNIIEVEFTARMEEELDLIEEGKLDWKQVVRDFYIPFQKELEKAHMSIEKVEIKDEEAGKECPVCGRPMVIKYGRFGKFMACSGFPECRHTESINEDAGVICPRCGGNILILKTKKGRKFYGCSNYPECEFRSWDKPTGEKCPLCGEALVEKGVKGNGSRIVCQGEKCEYMQEVRD
ncbi:DNA topoisomerase I [Thermosyntropha lipolytica DSM 11003]|uniref:DNA topoisomerase 1 n=1 Tax=Thermosyntropha lipolytica DSM 11003 TaxID=1123382 RepID=A0A1M5L1Z0_9FIRM|nr:type I DNA topoisomerase [Thermosyntropha lipolytica]SHG58769.1 DNA topoisomerase I [Thermosyntropha lipolytica DSM 11003]